MTRLLSALALTALIASPALAADMGCREFMAMDAAGQMAAVTEAMAAADAMGTEGAMASDAKATEGAMASDGAMSPEGAIAAVTETCTSNPDMMVGEAMGAMQ